MPTTYRECEDDVADLADELIRHHYHGLEGVRIKYLFHVHETAPLKNKGYPVPAKCKIHSLADRVAGSPDCTVIIDAAWWEGNDNLKCKAALDGILCELMTATDDDGKIITDDCGRPKLRKRPADYFITGYLDVAKRHGKNAVEVVAVAEATKKFHQLGLFSGNDMEPEAA